jgi:diacylglycerol kinase (ATP)
VGSGLPLGLAEKVTLIFCVLLVFFAEILNSALETLVDLATQEFDEKARVTKDAAAAAVLVLSIGSAVIFAALLVHNWQTVLASGAAHPAAGALRCPPRRVRGAADARPAPALGPGWPGLRRRARPLRRPRHLDDQRGVHGMTAGLLVLALAAARERASARATKNPAAT